MQFSDEIAISNAKARLNYWWGELWKFLNEVSHEDSKNNDFKRLTDKKDAAGWSICDHVVHMAVWEMGTIALLQKQDREEAMGFDKSAWEKDIDVINADIQKRYKHMSWVEVKALMEETHDRLLHVLDTMTDDDLKLPYNHFDPTSDNTDMIVWNIAGNSFGHYEEHLPWMRAIVEE